MDTPNLYETIVATTRALIIVLDADGRIVTFNPACERVSGYRSEEVIGRAVWDILLLPEEIDGVKAAFEELRTGHFPNTFENHWLTRSGERCFIEWSNSAVTDARGQVTRIIGTGIDVTDRRDAAVRSHEIQERFQELASAVPLVLWIIDPHSNQVPYVSPGFQKIWGRSVPDPASAFEIFRTSIHPDDREAMFRTLQRQAVDAEPGESEYRIIRPDGTVRWIHSRTFPILDEHGELRRIVGYAEDITVQKLADRALIEARYSRSALLTAIPDAAWLKDANGVFLEVNRGFLERFGLELSQVVGKTTFDLFPSELAERIAAEEGELIRTGLSHQFERSRMLNGKERWFEVIRSPVLDAGGHVTGIAGMSRDVTGRKLADAQRMARDAALRTALVKDVHHRIKNNLQGVITFVEQLATKHPEHESLWEALITRVNTIATVHGLFGTMGERELRLDQIILRLVSSLKILYGDLPVQLSVRSNAANVRVIENEIVPLALIVNELIMNAIKHARGTTGSDAVSIVLEIGDSCARIIIRDHTGKFPMQFDFDTGVGLGTGLSLVKSLLPTQGALLRFENTQGLAGTKVELTLRSPVIALSGSST